MLVGKFDHCHERIFIILQQNCNLVPEDEVLRPRCKAANVLDLRSEELFELVRGVNILLPYIQVLMEQQLVGLRGVWLRPATAIFIVVTSMGASRVGIRIIVDEIAL